MLNRVRSPYWLFPLLFVGHVLAAMLGIWWGSMTFRPKPEATTSASIITQPQAEAAQCRLVRTKNGWRYLVNASGEIYVRILGQTHGYWIADRKYKARTDAVAAVTYHATEDEAIKAGMLACKLVDQPKPRRLRLCTAVDGNRHDPRAGKDAHVVSDDGELFSDIYGSWIYDEWVARSSEWKGWGKNWHIDAYLSREQAIAGAIANCESSSKP